MRLFAGFIIAFALALVPIAHAQKEEASAQKEAAPAPVKIASMSWLKGYWSGDGYGGQVETVMGPPRAGVMLGYFRHTKADGRPGFYEICAIEEFEGSLRFVIKHFHPNWIGWEEKDHALQAKLVRQGRDEAVFGNITLRRRGKDRMEMEIVITAKDGSSRTEVLHLRRQPL